MLSNKEKYSELLGTEKEIPIFSRDWWLDAVCENWDVLLVEKDSNIIASLPYCIYKSKSIKSIKQPPLTQTNGIWIKYPKNQSIEKKLSFEKNVMNSIIDQILNLDIDYFSQNFKYNITNWLPFYWRGFGQTTRYTYIIPNIDSIDLEDLFSKFSRAKRKNIKRAETIVETAYGMNAREFYEFHSRTLRQQNEKISYTFDTFEKIYNAVIAHDSGQIIYARDENNCIHSALFIIWDENSAYDLISAIDPDYRDSGSVSLLIREIIKYVAAKTKHFDFEGSMIEGVENSFKQFATMQYQYFNINYMNRKFKTIYHIREAIKAIIKK